MPTPVSVINAHPSRRIPAGPVRRGVRIILKKERSPSRQAVDVVFLSNPAIRAYNRRFRKKDRPTDVLSFNYDEPDFLGEVLISLDRCRSQAREYGETFHGELALLITHGILHLCGYDHIKARDRKRMRSREMAYTKLFHT